MSTANKHVPAEWMAAMSRVKRPIWRTSGLEFVSQLVWQKTNEWSQIQPIVPYSLVHSPAHLTQSQCLPPCRFISANSQPLGYGREVEACSFFFPIWDAEKNEQLSLLTLSDEQRPDMAMVMYLPSPCMWHIEMIGVTAASDGFCTAAGAYVQRLNCRVGIHLKVGLKVKLKGCGARQSQGYVHINSFPKVLFLSCVKWHNLQRQN